MKKQNTRKELSASKDGVFEVFSFIQEIHKIKYWFINAVSLNWIA